MRASLLGFLRNGVLLLCLFAPSAWMIATIPPLWRDVDAYNQVTQDPLVATFWGHAPAYCYTAKVPLFLGQLLEPSRRTATSPETASAPLTNAGVGLLLIAQHLALCGAAFYFVLALSNFFWIRLVLALTWASNPLFYTFAHCVGSETLSMILIVLLAGSALRLIRSRSEPRWIDWYLFAIALCLCLLTRHINRLLVLLAPAAFLLSWLQDRASSLFASSDRQGGWPRPLAMRNFRRTMIAMGIGIACFAVANASTQALARKTRFHPHSRIGFTFLWRLHFLNNLSPESRAALLQKVSSRTKSTDARTLIALLGQMHKEGADLNAGRFMRRAIPLLFPLEGVVRWERLDGALNQMAFAFLLPPTSEYLHAAKADFVAALNMPVTEISNFLFESTAYYFQHTDEMPGCAELVTFRGASADQIRQIPSQHRYFRLWRGLTFNTALVIWFVSLIIFVFVARQKETNARDIVAFGIALTTIGLLMVACTCLVGEFIPRYGLPMWQLLLLSLYLFIGRTADLLANRPRAIVVNRP